MTAITGRTATGVESSSTTSITGTLPTDRVSGDLVVAIFAMTCTTAQFTGPSGWTAIGSPVQVPDGDTIAAYYRVDPPAAPTGTSSGSAGRASVICQAYGGVDPGTPLDVSAVTAVTSPYATELAIGGVTTATDGALLLSACLIDSSSILLTAPSGMTTVWDATGGSVGRGVHLAQESRATAGATGARTWQTSPSTSIGLGAVMVALRPAGVSVTGSLAATAGLSGGVDVGMAGTQTTAIGLSGGLLLGARATGSRTLTFGLSGAVSIISRVFTGTLEVELTPGSWTDFTSRLAFTRGALTVRQGRATQFDEISGGVLTCMLFNDDGALMPGNSTSTYYPSWKKGVRIRWSVTKSGTTWTRFVGWIQAIQPEYPSASTTGSVVTVTAVDALGLLGRRRLRSNFTETVLWRSRLDACHCDVYEASGQAAGSIATLTNYSVDAAKGEPSSFYSSADATLSFSSDKDVSIGGIVTSGSEKSCKTVVAFQANSLQMMLHLKGPGQQVSTAGTDYSCPALYSATALVAQLAVRQSGTDNILVLKDSGGTTLGTLATLPLGQWVRIRATSLSATPARTDWTVTTPDGTTTGLSNVAIDIRTVIEMRIPSSGSPSLMASYGGIAALATRTPINIEESFVALGVRTLAARIGELAASVATLPITISTLGTLTSTVATGDWSGRLGSEVLQEMLRTYGGLAWARSRDSVIYAMAADQLYPASPIATVDIDADCDGAPRLIDSTESMPTQVDVTWPGGTETVRDATTDATAESQSKRITTVAATAVVARAAGQTVLDRAVSGVRVSQVTVDLVTGATDHTAALFSEASTVSGLHPTQRLRLTVPASHFGASSLDVHVQGWTESYSPSAVTVQMDTVPAT